MQSYKRALQSQIMNDKIKEYSARRQVFTSETLQPSDGYVNQAGGDSDRISASKLMDTARRLREEYQREELQNLQQILAKPRHKARDSQHIVQDRQ